MSLVNKWSFHSSREAAVQWAAEHRIAEAIVIDVAKKAMPVLDLDAMLLR